MLFRFSKSIKFQNFIASYAGSKATETRSAFFVLSFLSVGTFFADLEADRQVLPGWAVVSVLSLILSLAFFVGVGSLINRYLPRIELPRFIAIVLLFFSTEMLRAVFVAVVEFELSLNDTINWPYRIVAGGCTGLIFLGLFSVNKNNSFNYRERLRSLISIKNELLKTTKVTKEDLVKIRSDATNAIKHELNSSLSGLLESLKSSPANYELVVSEVIRISDDVVRPVSYEIFGDQITNNQISSQAQKNNFSLRRVFELATTNPFLPMLTTALTALQIISLALFGVADKTASVIAFLTFISWIYVVLFLAEKFLTPLLSKINIFIRLILVTFVFWLVATVPFIIKFVGDNLRIPQTATFVFWLMAISTAILWPLAFYSGLEKARAEVLAEISEINEKLNWSVARLGAQLWNEKQKFAKLVHHEIQGKLLSSALKLKKDLSQGIDPSESISKIEKIVQSSTEFVNQPPTAISINEHVKNLNDLWLEIFQMSVQIDQDLELKLVNDQICLNLLNDLITEFATNSVKHGKASSGQIKLSLVSDNIVLLIMVNDGAPLPDHPRHGIGSQMALEQCIAIERQNLNPIGVEFKMTIPIN